MTTQMIHRKSSLLLAIAMVIAIQCHLVSPAHAIQAVVKQGDELASARKLVS